MAIELVNKKWCPCLDDYQREFIADAESDVASLHKSSAGSSALVVESGNIYVVNASGDWAVFGG